MVWTLKADPDNWQCGLTVAEMKPTFFRTPAEFHAWLEKHHASRAELLVGFHKKGSGRPSITWPESVDLALCFGWIDGVRRRIDEASYTIRFTPRKPGSIWSAVNIERAQALIAQGLMQPAGLKAFDARRADRSGIYSYEQRGVDLGEPYDRLLKENKPAWNFFRTQPTSYRKTVCWWITSAKREATRMRRFEKLAASSAAGQRLPQFTSTKPNRR